MATKLGLYANIAAKRERIAAGSKEKMRSPGDKAVAIAYATKRAAPPMKKGK